MVSVGLMREPSKLFQPKSNKTSFVFWFSGLFIANTRIFVWEKFLSENEPQKPKNLKKMLRKSPASDA